MKRTKYALLESFTLLDLCVSSDLSQFRNRHQLMKSKGRSISVMHSGGDFSSGRGAYATRLSTQLGVDNGNGLKQNESTMVRHTLLNAQVNT